MPASDHARQLFDQVSSGPAGTLPADLRTALVDTGTSRGHGEPDPPLPDALKPLVDKILDHQTSVAHADLLALLDAGYDEDGVFEVCIATATGAGKARLAAGLRALDQAEAQVALPSPAPAEPEEV